MTTTCRRCSECPNSTHHWIDNIEAEGPPDPTHVCKHCNAVGDECPDCDGDGEDCVAKDGMCWRCNGEGVIEVAAEPNTSVSAAAPQMLHALKLLRPMCIVDPPCGDVARCPGCAGLAAIAAAEGTT